MLRSGERVEDTSATTGTGATKTLDGSPPTGRVSFNAAFAKSAGNKNAVDPFKVRNGIVAFEYF